MRFVFINYRNSVGSDHIAQGFLHGTEEREVILFLGMLYKLYEHLCIRITLEGIPFGRKRSLKLSIILYNAIMYKGYFATL